VQENLVDKALLAAVGDVVRSERKKILEHVERRFKLFEIKAVGSNEQTRGYNLHKRLCALESAVRRLERGR
jgi:hypothetical protein